MRDNDYIVSEGIIAYGKNGKPSCQGNPGDIPERHKFRFSRMVKLKRGFQTAFRLHRSG